MSRKHFHVIVNMAGYMPDNDPDIVLTRRDAEASAKFHKDNFLEAGDLDDKGNWVPEYRAYGSARTGGYRIERTPYDPYSLDYYISIEGPCTDAACDDYFTDDGELDERWF